MKLFISLLVLACTGIPALAQVTSLVHKDGWQHMLDEERFAAALAENNFHESSLIADLEDSDAVRFVKRSYGSQIARKELLASLGLDVITAVPYLPRASRYVGWNVIRCGSNGLKQHHFVQKS